MKIFPISISYRNSNRLRRVFWITVSWVIISIFRFFFGYTLILDFVGSMSDINPITILVTNVLTGIIAGILGGLGVVYLWEKWLRKKNYSKALLSIFLSYNFVYLLVALVTGTIYKTKGILSLDYWSKNISEFGTLSQLESYLFWMIVVIFTLIVLQVNDKYGPGVLKSFILGRYFQPKKEIRIFMFLDLRSSTAIAEKLGEELYFNFLKDAFQDVTPAILNNQGLIYQYVGDEIVVSWRLEKGVKKINCIHCFFEIQHRLETRAAYYKSKYKVIPEFKAGLHYGSVMAGEIGIVKRDIVFLGDVLNTASRIQNMCNELGVNILVSKPLLDQLVVKNPSLHLIPVGNIQLRGKGKSIPLFTV